MSKKMFVTVLNYDTQACQSDTIGARKQRIEKALREANAFVAGKMTYKDNGREVWNIFAAPEYTFANVLNHDNHAPGDVRHVSEGTKVLIEKWLMGLSAQHSKTLIFPGSIAWKKSLTRDLGTYLRNKKKVGSKEDERTLTSRFQNKAKTRQEKLFCIGEAK